MSNELAATDGNHSSSLGAMFWLLWLVGVGGFGYSSWLLLHANSKYGWSMVGATVVFALFSGIPWKIGDVIRRAVMPDAYFTSGFKDLVGKRVFWAIGPQFVALAIFTVGLIYGVEQLGQHYGWGPLKI